MIRFQYYLIFALWSCGHLAMAQNAFLDSISKPDYVAWEYQLDELVIERYDQDVYNMALRYFKSDPLNSSDEIMEKLVGISAIKRGNYAFEPVMRGLSAGQINVTIDGMRVLGACTDKMDPVTSYVEPNNLEKLHISQGVDGFQAGSTVGGNFDMQIKKPPISMKPLWQTSFGSRFTSANHGIEALFNTAYSEEKFGIRVGGTYRKGENYRAGGGEVINFSGYNKVNYSIAASCLVGKRDLINVSLIGDNAWDVGYPALPMDVGTADAIIVGATYDKFLPGKLTQMTAKAYYNHVKHVMDDSNREAEVRMDMPGQTTTFGGYVKGKYTISEQLSGQVKFDAYHSLAYAEMTMYFQESPPMFMETWPDVERKVIGIHNQSTFKWNNKTTIAGGIRVEANYIDMLSELGERQISVFNFGDPNPGEIIWNANLKLDRELTEKISVDVKAGFGQRMPTEGEQYGFYLFNAYDGYDYVGRPDLKSEQSFQFETSMHFDFDRMKLDLTGYYYHFDRYIMGKVDPELSPMIIGANGVKAYENLDGAMLAGLESQLTYKRGRLDLLNITTYTYGKTIDNDPLPLMPPLKDNLEVNYRMKRDWVFTVGVEAAMEQHLINDDFGERPTPGYAIANCQASKTFSLRDVRFRTSLKVDNIFDANYYEHLDWGKIPRMGRNVGLSVYLNF